VALYLGSTNFSQLADATKYERSRILKRFREAHGDKAFGALERKHVEAMLAPLSSTPHAARALLKVLRAVTITALAAGLCTADPTAGIRIKVRKTSGFTALSEDDITQFEEHWARGTRERLAFALLLYSGQRRGDVIRMGRQHIRGGQLSVRQNKTGAILTIPVHPELAEIIAASDVGNLTFLTTETGKPFSPGYFTNWFGSACRAAGLPKGLSAHGLRKAICRRLAEAGCSANQISAISGHATLNEVSRYTKAADQKRMAVDAMGTISAIAHAPFEGVKMGRCLGLYFFGCGDIANMSQPSGDTAA
jgi:integrase